MLLFPTQTAKYIQPSAIATTLLSEGILHPHLHYYPGLPVGPSVPSSVPFYSQRSNQSDPGKWKSDRGCLCSATPPPRWVLISLRVKAKAVAVTAALRDLHDPSLLPLRLCLNHQLLGPRSTVPVAWPSYYVSNTPGTLTPGPLHSLFLLPASLFLRYRPTAPSSLPLGLCSNVTQPSGVEFQPCLPASPIHLTGGSYFSTPHLASYKILWNLPICLSCLPQRSRLSFPGEKGLLYSAVPQRRALCLAK